VIEVLRSVETSESSVKELVRSVLNDNVWTDGRSTNMVPSKLFCEQVWESFDRRLFKVTINLDLGIRLRRASAFHRWSEEVAIATKNAKAFSVVKVDYQVYFSSWVDTV
jgi:hypothetical protein